MDAKGGWRRESLDAGGASRQSPGRMGGGGLGAGKVRVRGAGEWTLRFEGVAAVRTGRGDEAGQAGGTLDVSLGPGEWLALVGDCRCGAGQVAAAVAGLGDVGRGRILLGGADVRRLAPATLRARVVYAGATPWLFSGSLRENLDFAVRPRPRTHAHTYPTHRRSIERYAG